MDGTRLTLIAGLNEPRDPAFFDDAGNLYVRKAVFSAIYLKGQAMLSVSRLPRAVSRLRTSSQSIRPDPEDSPRDSISALSCFRVPWPPK